MYRVFIWICTEKCVAYNRIAVILCWHVVDPQMLQLRDIHARLTILYEVTQRTHQYLVRGDSVLLDLMSTRLFRS